MWWTILGYYLAVSLGCTFGYILCGLLTADERCPLSDDCPIRVGLAPLPACTGYDECDHKLHLEG